MSYLLPATLMRNYACRIPFDKPAASVIEETNVEEPAVQEIIEISDDDCPLHVTENINASSGNTDFNDDDSTFDTTDNTLHEAEILTITISLFGSKVLSIAESVLKRGKASADNCRAGP
jgi:hypothetical protein